MQHHCKSSIINKYTSDLSNVLVLVLSNVPILVKSQNLDQLALPHVLQVQYMMLSFDFQSVLAETANLPRPEISVLQA